MQLQILGENNCIPQRTHIALDTCVFINAFKNPDSFKDLFEFFDHNNNPLTTTILNYFEFSKGNDTLVDFGVAKDWFDRIIKDFLYPVRLLEEEAEKIKLIYRKDGQKLKITDLFLAALAKKHKNDMLIMTKDHGDFIKDLFDIQAYMPYVHKSQVELYCFYRFSEDKYFKKLEKLERTKRI